MKRSKTLLFAAIIGTICIVYLFSYVGDAVDKNNAVDNAYQLGSMVGVTIALPSLLMSGIATIFAWVGWGTKKRGFALTSGILYAVAIVFMLPWFMFNILQMILSFVAYGTMGKNNG